MNKVYFDEDVRGITYIYNQETIVNCDTTTSDSLHLLNDNDFTIKMVDIICNQFQNHAFSQLDWAFNSQDLLQLCGTRKGSVGLVKPNANGFSSGPQAV